MYAPHSSFRSRAHRLFVKAPSWEARGALRLAVVAFGTALPLFAAALQTHGEDTAAENLISPTTDFTKLEPGEDKPGGGATSRGSTATPNAFSLSSGNMDFKRELEFKVGNGIFRKNWISAPSSTDASDGLGPLFNSRACQNCHLKDGRGHPQLSADVADNSGSMLIRLSVPPATEEEKERLASHRANTIPDPVYGGQLQDRAIQGIPAEGKLKIAYGEREVKLAGGESVSLRAPAYTLTDPGYGPMSPGLMISPRVAPPMIGLGLLEAIPQDQILANVGEAKDGVSGKPNRVWSREHDKVMLGRFGWKAGIPTIAQQTAEAASGDIGLSTTMIPHGAGDCTEKETACLEAPNGNSPKYQNVELGDELFKLVTFYAQNLAVPARRNPGDPQVLKGKEIFYGIGCASCHRPKFLTGEVPGQPHLSHQLIWPHTDLLLHDMGEGLADGRPEGEATGSEWRTPPLWGIGLTQTVSGHTLFLHDGRARNLTEAILWHGGEAKGARDQFADLPKADRDALLAFVNSL
ncbi:MAG TPA: di-heme oxidoredictase family protein [Methyloceanibacter sp.]|nr:di-heme oxidoredictase family protein [Methyloceanibacter sp.]